VIDWLFRNRVTGEFTIAQAPNAALIVFVVAWVLRWILDPSGWVGTALDVVVTAAITIWALDEIVRGVNPWRRILGATVLGFVVFGLATG
jgi:predicted neutral ceramidase superfamily lipid hydrolase